MVGRMYWIRIGLWVPCNQVERLESLYYANMPLVYQQVVAGLQTL